MNTPNDITTKFLTIFMWSVIVFAMLLLVLVGAPFIAMAILILSGMFSIAGIWHLIEYLVIKFKGMRKK